MYNKNFAEMQSFFVTLQEVPMKKNVPRGCTEHTLFIEDCILKGENREERERICRIN